jgi:hypothetical protein
MEVFKYTKLVSETGKNGLIALAICTVIAAFFFYKTLNKGDGSSSQYTIYILIALGIFFVAAGKAVFSRLNSTEAWEVVIDDEKLQWNAPDLIDKSFVVKLNQIALIEKKWKRDQNDANYVLKIADGSEISLNDASEIDFEAFTNALKNRGIKYKEVEDRAHQ